MKVVVPGGSSGVGRWVARRAVALGYAVRIMARRPERVDLSGVGLEAGDALDPDACRRAVKECDAVICTLGLRYGGGKLLESSDRFVDEEGVTNLVEAAAEASVRRFVLVSTLGAGESWSWLPWPVKRHFESMGARSLLAAKGRGEDALRNSALDWTIFRPGYLHNGTTRATPYCVEGLAPGYTARQAVADVCLRALRSPSTSQKTLTVVDGELAWATLFRLMKRSVQFDEPFVRWR